MISDVAETDASAPRPVRHLDDGRWLRSFLGDRCDVFCPRCGQRGVVRYAVGERGPVVARFTCSACAFKLDSAAGSEGAMASSWCGDVRLVGRRVCGYCGARWLHREKRCHASGLTLDSFDTAVNCHVCGRSMPLQLQASRIQDDIAGCEPLFGLTLALAEPVMPGKIVWAYNPAHLADLKAYIGAQLRERRHVGNASYFSRLPAWIKSARNRGKLMKAIGKIERGMAAR